MHDKKFVTLLVICYGLFYESRNTMYRNKKYILHDTNKRVFDGPKIIWLIFTFMSKLLSGDRVTCQKSFFLHVSLKGNNIWCTLDQTCPNLKGRTHMSHNLCYNKIPTRLTIKLLIILKTWKALYSDVTISHYKFIVWCNLI